MQRKILVTNNKMKSRMKLSHLSWLKMYKVVNTLLESLCLLDANLYTLSYDVKIVFELIPKSFFGVQNLNKKYWKYGAYLSTVENFSEHTY